jgi:hypothetical protein
MWMKETRDRLIDSELEDGGIDLAVSFSTQCCSTPISVCIGRLHLRDDLHGPVEGHSIAIPPEIRSSAPVKPLSGLEIRGEHDRGRVRLHNLGARQE